MEIERREWLHALALGRCTTKIEQISGKPRETP
ncbi:hypothetical protein J2732_001805 [Achromobacter deleyi]|nr:hypothetical protein [Achromobacter deleyi]